MSRHGDRRGRCAPCRARFVDIKGDWAHPIAYAMLFQDMSNNKGLCSAPCCVALRAGHSTLRCANLRRVAACVALRRVALRCVRCVAWGGFSPRHLDMPSSLRGSCRRDRGWLGRAIGGHDCRRERYRRSGWCCSPPSVQVRTAWIRLWPPLRLHRARLHRARGSGSLVSGCYL